MKNHLARLMLLLLLGGCPWGLPTKETAGGHLEQEAGDYRCQQPDPPEICNKMGDERD